MKKTKEEIIRLKFEKFLLKHASAYSEDLLSFVKDNFLSCINDEVPDILMQIYEIFLKFSLSLHCLFV